jgi:hypothetical protein
LRNGHASILTGAIERPGVRIGLELSFNREFRATASGGSWTRTMRPDCSLRIFPEALNEPLIEPVSLHFDAKYRVGSPEEIFGKESEELSAHADDLLKMHAYRDAILSAVGAYVIYPGQAIELDRKFDEIVPGLGAFPLSPGQSGIADGADRLRAFLDDVIDHVSARGSRRARATFWHQTSYIGHASQYLGAAPKWLCRPPADTIVLLGYVKSDAHLEWILNRGMYNLRADHRRGAVALNSSILRADSVFLYGPALGTRVEVCRVSGEPRVMTVEDLIATGYPEPGGKVYFCLAVERESALEGVDVRLVRSIIERHHSHVEGAPLVTTYLQIMSAVSEMRSRR